MGLISAALVIAALTPVARAQFLPAPNPPLPFPFPVGNGPVVVIAGNFNSDGFLDFAVLNQIDGTVTFILSTGPGTYAAASGPFPVGSNPSALVPVSMGIGDFDKDGNQDLAVANGGGNSVSVLLGDGNGGIKATLGPFPAGKNPSSIAVGQLNGDSYLDLVVTNRDSNNVTVLRGDGTGNFSTYPGSPFPVGNSPSSVAIADFNGDGYPDLAIANELDNDVTVLLGGAGSFQPAIRSPFLVGYNPSSIVAADFNLDGNLDLAVPNLSSSNVTVLLGDGTGGFAPDPSGPFNVGSLPVFVTTADFNGDDIPDLAIANSGSNNVTVYLGDGTGKFKPVPGSPFAAGSDPRSLTVGDFNGNGVPDIAVADYGSDSIALLVNTFTSTPEMVSAASFSPTAAVAPGSLVTILGSGLSAAAAGTAPSQSATTVSLKDASGAKYPVTLTYVSPTQINALLPSAAASGAGTFTVTTGSGALQTAAVTLAPVAPALFSANQSGKGVAAGIFFPDLLMGVSIPVFQAPTTSGAPYTAQPLDVSSGNSVLVLFGTGIRNRAKLSDVTVTVAGQSLPAFFAGPDPDSAGVDEVEVALPSSLAQSGVVYLTVSVGSVVSNQVTITIA